MCKRRRQPGTEPERLVRGKQFHKQVQADWLENAEGEVRAEEPTVKPSGRPGRMDVFVVASEDLVAIAEIKSSDWDAMTEKAVRRNAKRYARQLWTYIDSQVARTLDVCPGVVFPARPSKPGRLEFVEQLFEEEGIPVVWEDESIDDRKARA